MIRIALKTLIGLTVVVFICVIGVFLFGKYWISHRWESFYSKEEMYALASAINQTPEVNPEIIEAYLEAMNKKELLTMSEYENKVIWYVISSDKYHFNFEPCACLLAAELQTDNRMEKYHSVSWAMLAHGIEKYSTQKACFHYWVSTLFKDHIQNESPDQEIAKTKQEWIRRFEEAFMSINEKAQIE